MTHGPYFRLLLRTNQLAQRQNDNRKIICAALFSASNEQK